MEYGVRASGPLFDGTASARVQRYTEEGSRELAEWADAEVHRVLGQVLRNPTGYYESQVRVDRVSNDAFVISDGGVVYGPWLEGISERNQTTRFKGYGTFRRVAQRLESRADRTFAAILSSLGRM